MAARYVGIRVKCEAMVPSFSGCMFENTTQVEMNRLKREQNGRQ